MIINGFWETRYIDISLYTIALIYITSAEWYFSRKMVGETSPTGHGNALISFNRLNAVCTWGMRLFLFACRLHSTWHEWLHSSRCYIRFSETKLRAKSNPSWKRTVINVSRFDVGNKAAAVVARAFTLIEEILRLFESQDFSMENFSIDFYRNLFLDKWTY